MRAIPYEGRNWICQSFPHPRQEEQQSFDAMICNLAMAHIPTILHYTKRRILVTTWSPVAPA